MPAYWYVRVNNPVSQFFFPLLCCCQFLKFVGAEPDFFLDTKELHQENPNIPGRPVIFGPKFTAQRLYQLSPPEVIYSTLILLFRLCVIIM